MVDREKEYGQSPNRITDVTAFLTLEQNFRELERYIDSFGRTLTDNERRLQQTLPGIIKTFSRVNAEVQASGGKLSKSQAADLKVMLANEQNILKWLNQLSKFDPKTGLSRNERNDQSFIKYASIFNDMLEKMTVSMERAYKQWDGYSNSIEKVRQVYGLLPSAKGVYSSPASIPPAPLPQISPPPIKSIAIDLEQLYKALERLGELLSKNKISPNDARLRAYKVQTQMPSALANVKNMGTVVQRTMASKYGLYTQQPLTGAAKYAGLTAPTKGQIRAYKANKYLNKFGDSTNILNNLHKALGTLPIIGKVTGLAANMSKGGNAMRDAGGGLAKLFGKSSLLGKAGALLAGPIGIAIGATAVAVGAIYKQMKKSSPVLQAVSDLFSLAWNLLWMPLGNALSTTLLPMAETLIEFAISFNRLFSDFSFATLLDFTMRLGEVFTAALQTVFNLLFDTLWSLGNALPKLFGDLLFDGLEALFTTLGWDGAVDVLKEIRNWVNKIQTTVHDWIRALPSILAAFPNVLLAGLKSLLSGEDFVEGVKGRWNDTIGKWTGVKLASGGVVTGPTIAMVGEAGPEAVIPLDKAGGIGATYVININGDVYGVSDLESRIERVIQRTANKSYYR